MLSKLKALREEREEGFTLIELLVVILIIGILAAIAIPVFLNQRQTANDGAVQADVKNAATQVESWIAGNPNATTLDISAATTSIKSALKVSPGVSIAISGTPNGYCIYGSHSNGKSYKSTTPTIQGASGSTSLNYTSLNGGLAGTCSTATTGAVPGAWLVTGV